MRNLNLILLFAGVACFGQACKSGSTNSTTSADSANTAKIDTAKKDSGKMTAISQGITVDKDDAKFAVEAANGGMAEVELGKLAQNKGMTNAVKSFGVMMVTDHTKANDELMALAKSKGITLPSDINSKEKKLEVDLNQKSGKDFDKAYTDAMIDDHKEDIKAFEKASANLKDADLKAFAVKTLPTLKMHLDSIEVVKKGLK